MGVNFIKNIEILVIPLRAKRVGEFIPLRAKRVGEFIENGHKQISPTRIGSGSGVSVTLCATNDLISLLPFIHLGKKLCQAISSISQDIGLEIET